MAIGGGRDGERDQVLHCGRERPAGDLREGGGGQADDADRRGGHRGRCHEAGGDQPQRVLQVQGCGAAVQRYEGGAHHHLLLYAQGQHRRALQRAVRVCHFWGQHPHHQPEHSHQRLRGGDDFRRDQRTGGDPGEADGR